jgi:hypothetical protein
MNHLVAKTKPKRDLDLSRVKNITQPDSHGIQVRIQHQGKEHSKYFSFSFWEEESTRTKKGHSAKAKKLALQSAIKWRDDMKLVLGKNKTITFRKKALANNRSTGVVGVSRYQKYDRRKNCHYTVYSVSWCEWVNGRKKRRVTAFNAGRSDEISAQQERAVLDRAIAFRQRWEEATLNQLPFSPKEVLEILEQAKAA